MDQGIGLILLSGVMMIGSYCAGLIPIVMHMSEVLSVSVHSVLNDSTAYFFLFIVYVIIVDGNFVGKTSFSIRSWCWFASWYCFRCNYSGSHAHLVSRSNGK